MAATPDEYGANFATVSTQADNPFGRPHIIDHGTGKRLYQSEPCRICGVVSWEWTPEPRPCGACKRGRVAKNENEAA